MGETAVEGGGLAGVGLPYDFHPGITHVPGDIGGPVGRPVIDDDDLQLAMTGVEQRPQGRPDPGLLVVRRDQHGHRPGSVPHPGRSGPEPLQPAHMGPGEHREQQQPQHAQPAGHPQNPDHGGGEDLPDTGGPDQPAPQPPLHERRRRVRDEPEPFGDGGEPLDAPVPQQPARLLVRALRLAELPDDAPRRLPRPLVGGHEHVPVAGGLPRRPPLAAAQGVGGGGARHPQQIGPLPGGPGEGALGQLELGLEAGRGRLPQHGPGVRVGPDLMPLGTDAPHQLRVAGGLSPVHEERGPRPVGLQQVQQPRGPHGVGTAVEGERDGPGGHRAGPYPVLVDPDDGPALGDGLRHGRGTGCPRLRGVDLVLGPALEDQEGEDEGEGEGEQQPVGAGVSGLLVTPFAAAGRGVGGGDGSQGAPPPPATSSRPPREAPPRLGFRRLAVWGVRMGRECSYGPPVAWP